MSMFFSKIMFKLYKYNNIRSRNLIIRLLCKFEGGEYYSLTLRKIFKEYHLIEIGLYSRGFIPFNADKYTKIGRYCSISRDCIIMNRNHPKYFRSMHAFFFNKGLKFCHEDQIEFIPLEIGNDVWIGANAIILPRVKSIGTGALIGAGTIVTKDVPPYAIVVGNPGKIIEYRFSQRSINNLLASRWWEKPIEELNMEEFTKHYKEES